MRMSRINAVLLVFAFLPVPAFPSEVVEINEASVIEKPLRKCYQCVGGNFLSMKFLMVDTLKGHQMNWKRNEWADTDCLEGIVNEPHDCNNMCVTIYVQKWDDAGWVHDSVLKDCSDDLLIASPDLPANAGQYDRNIRNKVYERKRTQFHMTYEFTADSHSNDTEALAKELQKLMSYLHPRPIKMTKTTKYLYIAFASFVSFCIVLMCCGFLQCWCTDRRPKPATKEMTAKKEEIELAMPEPEQIEIIETGNHETESSQNNALSIRFIDEDQPNDFICPNAVYDEISEIRQMFQ